MDVDSHSRTGMLNLLWQRQDRRSDVGRTVVAGLNATDISLLSAMFHLFVHTCFLLFLICWCERSLVGPAWQQNNKYFFGWVHNTSHTGQGLSYTT